MIEKLNVDRLKPFFKAYRELEDTFWRQRVEEETAQFNRFKPEFEAFNARLQKLRKEEAPFFNLFHILKISHYETRVHTPFLCHLLNPSEAHEQGSLFLNSFFKEVLGLDYTYETISHFEIQEERRNDFGQIDILLKFESGGVAKAVMIENKIYAAEQEAQIERYYAHLISKFGHSNFWMIYLTRNCDLSVSISPPQANILRKQGLLKERGYHQHIIPWLENCYSNISSPKVQYTLLQYLKTIAEL